MDGVKARAVQATTIEVAAIIQLDNPKLDQMYYYTGRKSYNHQVRVEPKDQQAAINGTRTCS